MAFFLDKIIGFLDDGIVLKGIFSVAFNNVNSPIKGVVTFLSEKQPFKQEITFIFVPSGITVLMFTSNRPFSSAVVVKLLLSYSTLTLAYAMVCPEIASIDSVIG